MKICKMCNTEISNNRIYCSNKCKYSDPELNAKRVRLDKNDKNNRLQCTLCDWNTKDINNMGGYPKKHLRKIHNIIDDDYMKYYTVYQKENIITWKCPECGWETKDIGNRSGCITVHIKIHNITEYDFYKKHPDCKISTNRLDRREILENNNIICQICGETLFFITNSHLKMHGITQKEYKEKYGDIIISNRTKNKLSFCVGTKNPCYASKSENEIRDFLLNNNIKVHQSYKKLGPEIDLFLPEYNIGIEFNGLYWHSELSGNKNKNYHIDKTNHYKNLDIQLIHIFEDEWLNKNEIVKSRLLHILNKNNSIKIYARKCNIKEISNKQKNEFLNENHLQGSDKSSILIGAFYNNELVAVMTFSNPRVSLGNKIKNIDNSNYKIMEMSRFAMKLGMSIVGIFSKLIRHFHNNYDINSIYTYADIRYSKFNDNVYFKNGFSLLSITRPNYFYMEKYKIRLHRYNFTKHKILSMGGNKDFSEWDNMRVLGYDRIWDCGALKYELRFS